MAKPGVARKVTPRKKATAVAPVSPPRQQVVVIAIAAVLCLLLGYLLARWTSPASSAVDTSSGDTPAHSHAVQAGPGAEVGGLSLSAAGYALVPERTAFGAGAADTLRFRITGPDGAAVTSFVTVQEKPLHLVLARRDLGGFQHLHPTMAADGVWSVPVTLDTPGPWRAVADFSVTAANGAQTALALGVDLTVAGSYAPAGLPEPAREFEVDGYTVTYEGTLRPGASQPLVFRVFRSGSMIPALEPYLGALGHLVALREGDVGYVHVHSDPPTSASDTKFWLTAPSAGRYRLYFDFKFGGAVHTAAFTVAVA